jgi:hypothetical protein
MEYLTDGTSLLSLHGSYLSTSTNRGMSPHSSGPLGSSTWPDGWAEGQNDAGLGMPVAGSDITTGTSPRGRKRSDWQSGVDAVDRPERPTMFAEGRATRCTRARPRVSAGHTAQRSTARALAAPRVADEAGHRGSVWDGVEPTMASSVGALQTAPAEEFSRTPRWRRQPGACPVSWGCLSAPGRSGAGHTTVPRLFCRGHVKAPGTTPGSLTPRSLSRRYPGRRAPRAAGQGTSAGAAHGSPVTDRRRA